MSVTIVSMPKASAQTATTDAATDDAAAGDDFANLLQDQLAAALTPATSTSAIALALPAASAKADDPGDDAAATGSDAAFDATSLLATLAIVTPQANNGSSKPIGDASETTATGGSALPALQAVAVEATEVSAKDAASVRDEAGETKTAAVPSETAAKFAVAVAAAQDKPVRQETTSSSDSDVQLPTGESAHVGLHATSGKHALSSDAALEVKTPLRNQDWSSDFSQKIVWLANSDTQSAQITINPQDLGPIEVSLSINQGNASVSFASASSEVRNAIETAMPRLREMFANAGIELGQTNVGAQSSGQQSWNGNGQQSASRSLDDNAILAASVVSSGSGRTLSMQHGNGLVDLFA